MPLLHLLTPLGRLRTRTPSKRQSLPTRILGAIALISASVTILGLLSFSLFGLRLNTTPSMPVGIYRITSNANASLVAFCLTGQASTQSMKRNYRPDGTCPDGGAPLLKAIIARAGDQVDVTPQGLQVNHFLLKNTQPRLQDRASRPLVPWPQGHYTVPPGYVWVASTFNPYSYDSRYYGPIATEQIRYRLKELLIFGAR